jgi:hypothetical protein
MPTTPLLISGPGPVATNAHADPARLMRKKRPVKILIPHLHDKLSPNKPHRIIPPTLELIHFCCDHESPKAI